MSAQWSERARVHGVLADAKRLAVLHHVALGDRTPRQLSALLNLPMPLLTHHLKTLAESGLISRTPSEHDRRQRFIGLDNSALPYLDHQWLRQQIPASSARVVFACTHNSARSVLASALWSKRFNRIAGAGGTSPGSRIHPATIRTARKHEVPLLQDAPVHLEDVLEESDVLVTVCDAANNYVQPHPLHLHWSIPDPVASNDPGAFDAAFDHIVERIDRLGTAMDAPLPKESKR